MRRLFFLIIIFSVTNIVSAQELRARINVLSNRLGSNVDKKTFQTLQNALNNFTAVISYYVDIILGLDYDSFSARGGDIYFQKAQNIVNNAPDGRNISGWKAFDGTRNRYWLVENLLNSRYTLIHDAYYRFYRS